MGRQHDKLDQGFLPLDWQCVGCSRSCAAGGQGLQKSPAFIGLYITPVRALAGVFH